MKKATIAVYLGLWSFVLFGNNVTVSSVTTSGQDVTAGANNAANFTNIEFNVDWDYSWRTSGSPYNWDAVWVFAKYRIETGGSCAASSAWSHCTLSATDGNHTVTTTNGTSATAKASGDGKGVFFYRSADGSGSVNWDDVKIRWMYRTDGLFDDCRVTVRVFAIEMVYVPQGSFYAGDGSTTSLEGHFEAATTSAAFQVTGEGALTLGGGGAGSLGNNNAANMATADDFNDASSRALPAAFPKGYNAFYCMKYEISQQQYVEFLNTLNGTQQAARTSATTAGNFHNDDNTTGTPQSRCAVTCKTAPVGATPGEYACDLDDDGTYNESTDGMYTAMNWITPPDLLAYLDWAALRPMTELEYEKACRGTLTSIAGEYAWGNTYITYAAAISGGGSSTEAVTTVNANCSGNNSYSAGPLRCGIFATAGSARVSSGGSHYGIMELSGNVWEQVVLLGCVAGRAYTGLHGNGTLNAAGTADVDYWPGINGNSTTTTANGVYGGVTGCTGRAGISFTGGTFNSSAWMRVSDRDYRGSGWGGILTRDVRNGGRGVKTAP